MESLQIGRKEQVVVNGRLASVLLFAETCVFVLTHAITTVMSCDESDVSVEFCINSSLWLPSLLAQFHSPFLDISSPFRWKLEVRNDFLDGHYGWNSPLVKLSWH
jgi:hypothetical protein